MKTVDTRLFSWMSCMKAKTLLLISFLCFCTVAFAQSSETFPINLTDEIMNLQWTEDGRHIKFQEGSVSTPGSWYEYQIDQINTNNLSGNDDPLVELTTPPELANLPLATDAQGNASLTFLSPDRRYIVYAPIKRANWQYTNFPLAITDLQTNQSAFIEGVVVPVTPDMDSSYTIYWSENSQTFAVFSNRMGSNPRIYYVTNFTDTFEAMTVTYLDSLAFNTRTIYPVNLFDISSDGVRILLTAVVSGESTRRHWFIWDAQNPEQSQLVTENLPQFPQAAAFAYEDEQKIVYLDELGLSQYDLQTGQSTILDSTLASDVDQAVFSPDARHLALLKHKSGYESVPPYELYVVAVPVN